MPVLSVTGGKSPARMRHGMQALTGILSGAEIRILAGQTTLKPAGLAAVLEEFFSRTGPGLADEARPARP
jgi:hypothetical protein